MDQQELEYVYPPRHPRRPMVLGAIGIVCAPWCPPIGVALGIASIGFVRTDGGRYVWGTLAIAVSVIAAVVSAVVLILRAS